ncbi:unnamed protein product, partial [marine sediment metagenome]
CNAVLYRTEAFVDISPIVMNLCICVNIQFNIY